MKSLKSLNIKTAVLAIILATGFPLAAQAQDTKDYESLKVSCQSGVECNNFNVNLQEQGDEIAQTRRTRTRRTRSSSSSVDSKYYVGGTLGIFFPSEIDNFNVPVTAGGNTTLQRVNPGTGFGGSIYGGYNFSELISADAEALIYFGNADPLDGSYRSFNFFVGPKFTYTLDKTNDQSLYIFASPGIGVGNVNFGGDLGDALSDDSGTGFALQVKAGVGYPVSDKVDIIGQARYTNIFGAFDVPQIGENGTVVQGETDSKGVDAFGLQIGAQYNF
ncbi:outer membrane beta-barrel protein [Pleurocapsa sp. CCALA 161]|uniref:outer membrane beta-barrel protein n=1 Tax=Pleurocapsa sp. CCALA 161 TaxID=2107688 RepID=UPI001304BC77|nr:outer membrane beta-barrel protein [Pleurocapsa sp. CCALA 161]